MSNRVTTWRTNVAPAQQPNVQALAADTAFRIAERPSWVRILRRNPSTGLTDTLPAQQVRIELVQSIRGATEKQNALLDISDQYVVLMGFKDHPTYPNTDIKRADQFFFNERMYEVVEFIDTLPGRLMASAEVTP